MIAIKSRLRSTILFLCILVGVMIVGMMNASSNNYGFGDQSMLERGRYLVTSVGGCADCHSVGRDPNNPTWLAGFVAGTPGQPFEVGPLKIYPSNITPDKATGIGNWTPQQIFNALRLGKDDDGKTLCPPMPWPVYRNMTDRDIWSIVSYLKKGIKPVKNKVPENVGPDGKRPDCAPLYSDLKPLPRFPGTNEIKPRHVHSS
jgi:mono/diheme cytochrome c family protein